MTQFGVATKCWKCSNGLGYKLSCDTGVQFFHLSQGVATRVYEIGFTSPMSYSKQRNVYKVS